MGYKRRKGREKVYSQSPDTYHRVSARSKAEALGTFLKGTNYSIGEVVVRKSPPKKKDWTVGANFASKKNRWSR